MSRYLMNSFLYAPYSGWTPANGPSPYAWYAGDEANNTNNGTKYTKLHDKSGNARHLNDGVEIGGTYGFPIATGASGINGRSVMNLSSGGPSPLNHRAKLPSSSGMLNAAAGFCVAFLVDRTDTGAYTQTLFFAETSAQNTSRANVQIEGSSDDTPRIVYRRASGDSASIQAAAGTVADPGLAVVVAGVDVNGRIARVRVNGTETTGTAFGTAGAAFDAVNSYDGVWLFATNDPAGANYEGFKGKCGEIVLYNSVTTQAIMEKIEGYLAWTWGVLSLLPGAHPYKSSRPPL